MSTSKISKSPLFFNSRTALLIFWAWQFAFCSIVLNEEPALCLGFVSHHATNKVSGKSQAKVFRDRLTTQKATVSQHCRNKATLSARSKRSAGKHKIVYSHDKKLKSSHLVSIADLHSLVSNMKVMAIAPGVIYKKSNSPLRVNVLDIDTVHAPVFIKPIVACSGAARLQTVNSFAAENHALAAINANYFKKNGEALGTLVVDGDWVAGPIYDRVALGISKSGFPRIDKVNLGGMLYTSNLGVPKLWINNVNQMHRTGSRVIAYTRRWGSVASLPYDGTLVAIDAQGRVVGKASRQLTIPYGGIVLTDSKTSLLAGLKNGDITYLRWKVTPSGWDDVAEAVSGGPILIKHGNYCIDLPDEKFRGNWASNSIKARTACGITADNRLLLVTVEGTHSIFDLAHILHDLGAVEAMNLDGGGSTTMVVHNATVNMENKSNQRRVAAALGIFQMANGQKNVYDSPCRYVPRRSLLDVVDDSIKLPDLSSANEQEKALTKDMLDGVLKVTPSITADGRNRFQINQALFNKTL